MNNDDAVTTEDMLRFMEGSADSEMVARIRTQLSDPNSFASQFIDEWADDAQKMQHLDLTKLFPIHELLAASRDAASPLSEEASSHSESEPPNTVEWLRAPVQLGETPILTVASSTQILLSSFKSAFADSTTSHRLRHGSDVPRRDLPISPESRARESDRIPITFHDTWRWLHLSAQGQEVHLRLGNSPADGFTHYRLRFLRSTEVVHEIVSQGDRLIIVSGDLEAARLQNADNLIVVF